MKKNFYKAFFAFILMSSLQNPLHSMYSSFDTLKQAATALKPIVKYEPVRIAALSFVPFLASASITAFDNTDGYFKELKESLWYNIVPIAIPMVFSTALAELGKWPKVSAGDLVKPSLLGGLTVAGILLPTAYHTYQALYNWRKESKRDGQPYIAFSTFGNSLAGYSFFLLPLYALAKRIQAARQ